MITHRTALSGIIVACLALGSPAAAQTAPDAGTPTAGRFATAVYGGLAGLGLAVAYIAPDGEGWLVSDEMALPVAGLTGLVVGLLAPGISPPAGTDGPGRVVVTAGAGRGMDWDYSLSYRVPVRPRLAVEGALLVMSESWERIATETRCGMIIGCITGDFVVDHRYRQNVAALMRGHYRWRPGSSWDPALVLGAGPVLAHAETADTPEGARTAGFLLDAGVTVGRGARARWHAETGYRQIVAGDMAGTGHMSGPYLRLGVGLATGLHAAPRRPARPPASTGSHQ
jgi:hypothetical protein